MNKLKEFRIQLRLTQAQLAAKSGLSQAYINELEKGKKTNPSIAALARIARALDIPLTQLLRDEFRAGITAVKAEEVTPPFSRMI